ncbi:hypothetical protein E4U22_006471 [Claviceps purpurea]|nr:hypothetical protein E4U22_006471 [Claviceps purpurea]
MSNKRANISSFRELIQDLIREDYRQEEILSRVNTQLDAQNQRALARSRRRTRADPDSHSIHEGSRQSDILRIVNEQLSANNQRTIILSTLQRNIRDWGFNQKTNQTDTNSV